jgi:hypothetical protein
VTTAHELISNHYGTKCAERSGVPLINHINEGLVILDALGANGDTKDAWCLHPLVQDDSALASDHHVLDFFRPRVSVLVMEYRNQANAWLSDSVYRIQDRATDQIETNGLPTPGPLPEVRQMLIADKVQNYKDFIHYHHGKHERSSELHVYFRMWLDALGVTSLHYTRLCDLIEEARK